MLNLLSPRLSRIGQVGTVIAYEDQLPPLEANLEVFADLYITGAESALDRFILAADPYLTGGWSRDSEAELRIQGSGTKPTYVFAKKFSQAARALLFLVREPHRLKVTNIVPQGTGRLSRQQYNSILRDFSNSIAEPVAVQIGLEVTRTSEQRDLRHWLSDEAADALESFSSHANKSSGSSHPSDFELWARFLIQAHHDHSTLDTQTLERWLVEEQNWPSDVASDLTAEFEFSRRLLNRFDHLQ